MFFYYYVKCLTEPTCIMMKQRDNNIVIMIVFCMNKLILWNQQIPRQC